MKTNQKTPENETPKLPDVGCNDLLAFIDILRKMVGRCEALELEAKNRRSNWGSDKSGGDAAWHFNYGQEGAYRTMAKHLEDAISNIS